jgi:voltage-gated potassium channel
MIILFGYSKLAADLALRLKKDNKEFIIIEPNRSCMKFVKSDNLTPYVYDFECYDDEELISLGIKDKVKTLFCMHNDFNKNLFVSLSARNLNKKLQIISYCNDNNEAKKLKLAGANTTINPYETAGLKIFRQIHKPMAVKILDDILYKNSYLDIQEIRITEYCILNGKMFDSINLFEKHNLIFLGIQDKEISNEFIFSSRGINHKIDEDDVIVVLGHKKDIKNFKKEAVL